MEHCCVLDPTPKNNVALNFNILHAQTPVVTQIDKFLTERESTFLIEEAEKLGMARSTVTSSAGAVENQGRTSSTAFLPKSGNDIISCIEKKISTAAGLPMDNLEPLQVTRYQHKQKYDSHYDWFEGTKTGEGQRTKTVFSYLKGLEDDGGKFCGGATAFPNLKDEDNQVLRAYPVSGNAVMWSNVTHDGTGDTKSLHGGEPVLCEGATKVGLNAWFRDKPWT